MSGPPPVGGRHKPVSALAFATAALFVCGWGGNQFTPLLTLYRLRDGWTATTVDELLGAYVLGLAPALIGGAHLSDRTGRRMLVLAALVTSIAGSLCIATAGLAGVAAGRVLSGVGVGLAMSVGTSWAAELAIQDGAPAAAGARRASLSLTAGFGAGAAVAGTLAQWGPAPRTLPYLVHAVLALAVLGSDLFTESRDTGPASLVEPAPAVTIAGQLLPAAQRRSRMRLRVVPMAPWVFGAAGVAYAILPQAMAHHVGHLPLLYATFLTVITLSCGILVQPAARRLDHATRATAMCAGLGLVVVGTLLAAEAVAISSPVLAAVAAVVLGASYGIGLIAGLLEVQRIATPDELAARTGRYYALTYVGFLFPAALAWANRWVAQSLELYLLAGLAALCLAVVSTQGRRFEPGAQIPT